jgi:hypothetical protein
MGYAEQTVNATYLNEMYAAANDPNLNRRKGFIYSLVQGGWPIGALVAAALNSHSAADYWVARMLYFSPRFRPW